MKKYIMILAVTLICRSLFASIEHQDFQTIDNLIAYVKQKSPDHLLYETNGNVVGVTLPLVCCTDHNLHLLSEIKTLRYLHIFGVGGTITTNGIQGLTECSNLTGLGVTCGGHPLPARHLVTALPCLTNLQSLTLAQNSYMTNDATYLAKMTNLIALEIAGRAPQTRREMLALTNMINLRKLVLFGDIKDTNIFSRFNKSTEISTGFGTREDVWKKSFSTKENTTTDK